MVTCSSPDPTPARQLFLQRLAELSIKPTAREYYVRWAEAWTKARGNRSPDATRNFFDALSRSTSIADWQYRQAIHAARILAVDVLAISWALNFDWQSLEDQARSPESGHRSFGRESIPVKAAAPELPPAPAGPLPPLEGEIQRLADAMRRTMRLAGLAYATEQSYIGWVVRFVRFCLLRLKRTPQEAGPPAIGAYLDYLALERNISPATQNQALNALAFLTKKVFGIADFTLDPFIAARGKRRPPTVMTREEARSVIAQLPDPWKLAAELMYGSGLRLAECLRLRVKDLDFGQGTITIHDGKGGKHRVVPLPRSLEPRLGAHLDKVREKHLQDLPLGAGDVHMPEALLRKWPNATRQLAWQYLFGSATLCPHPRTGRIARHHLHETSMQRQFKDAVRKAGIAKRVTCHTMRHCFATHLLESGMDIRTVQSLMGHGSVDTTMIYLHVMKRPGAGGQSPLDLT
jgi:integron integrase